MSIRVCVCLGRLLAPPLGAALLLSLFVRLARKAAPGTVIATLNWQVASLVRTVQFLLFAAAFSVAFGFGDAGNAVPLPIAAATMLLAFPFVCCFISFRCFTRAPMVG